MKLPAVDLNRLYVTAMRFIKANKTTIYAGLASGGVIGTGITWAKAAVKSKEYAEENPEADFKDKVKHNAKIWFIPVTVAGVTIFCIVRGHKIHLEKEASLAAMSAFWKQKHDDLEKKVEEKLGTEQAAEIKEEILQEKMEKKGVPSSVGLPEGMFWVYDEYSDQFIKTSGNQLTWAMYCVNKRFATYGDVEYNWFLGLIGGYRCDKLKGCGWSWDNETQIEIMEYNGMGMWIECQPDIFDSFSKQKEGAPAAVLTFNYPPDQYDTWQ